MTFGRVAETLPRAITDRDDTIADQTCWLATACDLLLLLLLICASRLDVDFSRPSGTNSD